ncbi:hypothetical protein [Stenotrophomonas oahuensis]|uniref:Transmembrane protein n=1 Tax=Stenotrophomonas oahuensis TaxID=3003271 RepID=A0ABY9YQ97_9GAMM|nr:hypothetical protein [Stenotrophomonas sp. A5586]WNH52786.1 hypothetical protein PDM29_00510 [Stenotrophomonas sp. A5586]
MTVSRIHFPAGEKMDRRVPRALMLSIALLVATHAIAIWQLADVSNTLGVALWLPYTALAVIYLLVFAWLALILLGKRWARTVYTAVAILGLFSYIPNLDQLDVLDWCVGAIKLAALGLLHLPSNDFWFGKAQETEALT